MGSRIRPIRQHSTRKTRSGGREGDDIDHHNGHSRSSVRRPRQYDHRDRRRHYNVGGSWTDYIPDRLKTYFRRTKQSVSSSVRSATASIATAAESSANVAANLASSVATAARSLQSGRCISLDTWYIRLQAMYNQATDIARLYGMVYAFLEESKSDKGVAPSLNPTTIGPWSDVQTKLGRLILSLQAQPGYCVNRNQLNDLLSLEAAIRLAWDNLVSRILGWMDRRLVDHRRELDQSQAILSRWSTLSSGLTSSSDVTDRDLQQLSTNTLQSRLSSPYSFPFAAASPSPSTATTFTRPVTTTTATGVTWIGQPAPSERSVGFQL
jgi:hypothetical protein